jgi:hypothetical protein
VARGRQLPRGGDVQTALELPQTLYDRTENAARAQGISITEFVARALEDKLRAAYPSNAERQHVHLPLVPSARPGSRRLSAEQVAELMNEDDVPR